MLSLWQRTVEMLFVYKQSHFYTAHLAIMVLFFSLYVFCFVR